MTDMEIKEKKLKLHGSIRQTITKKMMMMTTVTTKLSTEITPPK